MMSLNGGEIAGKYGPAAANGRTEGALCGKVPPLGESPLCILLLEAFVFLDDELELASEPRGAYARSTTT